MTEPEDILHIVNAKIRRATIDLNQAGNYFENSDHERFRGNVLATLASLEELVKVIENTKTTNS